MLFSCLKFFLRRVLGIWDSAAHSTTKSFKIVSHLKKAPKTFFPISKKYNPFQNFQKYPQITNFQNKFHFF
jgi:hypothetical protein